MNFGSKAQSCTFSCDLSPLVVLCAANSCYQYGLAAWIDIHTNTIGIRCQYGPGYHVSEWVWKSAAQNSDVCLMCSEVSWWLGVGRWSPASGRCPDADSEWWCRGRKLELCELYVSQSSSTERVRMLLDAAHHTICWRRVFNFPLKNISEIPNFFLCHL